MTDPRKQHYESNKLAKRLRRQVGQAITDYEMIEAGDRVMVCLSGGKDSYAMLDVLLNLRRRAPVRFDIVAVHLDQKQPGYPQGVIDEYLRSREVEYRVVDEDTYRIVKRVIPEGQTTCSLCSRLRRGILYRVADELGADKIALGHHRDDILETFFLNLFHGGQLKAMPAKLKSDDGHHIVIRPLAYCREGDLVAYARNRLFPVTPCDLCGSQPDLERRRIKAMLQQWEREQPGRIETMSRALRHVVPSHLADPRLFDFAALGKEDVPDPVRRVSENR